MPATIPASVFTAVPVTASAVAPASVAPPAAPPQVAAPAADRAAPEKISTATRQTVTGLRYWTPALVALRVTRDDAFAFTPGHYARLGITDADGSVVFRPLSIASAPADRELEFVCTLIPGGEFSTRLAALRVGDAVEVDGRSYGFLTVDSLAPGADLWLLASGTGLAPFLSMLRDHAVWRAFDRLVVVHSVRPQGEVHECGTELRRGRGVHRWTLRLRARLWRRRVWRRWLWRLVRHLLRRGRVRERHVRHRAALR